MAVIWRLPVVYVCENNLYMEYTPIGQVTAVEHPAADRASAYGLEPIVVDGNDVDEVHETAVRLVDRAREGGGPALVEAKTYRHGGHSRADPAKYRPEDEVKEWLARDPIPAYRERLLASGVDAETVDRIDREALETVDRATEEAKAGPFPDPGALETELWADGGSAWRS
jgi:pyruvate dehydrogenase E1 component alpha subunit